MRLRHVYVQDILNTTMVVVLQFIFYCIDLYIEMGPPRLESQVKESQSCAGLPLFAQEGVGA